MDGHLDAIKSEDVQRLKRNLEAKSPETVNNILAVLSAPLKKAVEWEAHPPSHVLLAPGDAWRAGARDSGARRAHGFVDDAALHAPEPGGTRQRQSAP